jgi:uncharacterized protein with HEPN domain
MDDTVRTWLYDISTAIQEIDSFFDESPKHGYDSISDETIWGIIINHLPVLKTEVELLLDE